MLIETDNILEIVRNTRKISIPHFGNTDVRFYKSNSATDVVTEIDVQIEDFLKIELAKVMPEVSFVGEETGGNRKKNIFWLTDPIDGTSHYIRGLPFCTTMLSMIENEKVVFSIIYDFVNDIIYHAELNAGAYKNGEKMSVSSRSLSAAYLFCEINYNKKENLELFLAIKNRVKIVDTISAGFEFASVASGKMEGRITYDPFGKDYDFAPGSLLIREAGGIVRNFKSDNYNYKNYNFIASNPKVYEELVKSEDGIERFMC